MSLNSISFDQKGKQRRGSQHFQIIMVTWTALGINLRISTFKFVQASECENVVFDNHKREIRIRKKHFAECPRGFWILLHRQSASHPAYSPYKKIERRRENRKSCGEHRCEEYTERFSIVPLFLATVKKIQVISIDHLFGFNQRHLSKKI